MPSSAFAPADEAVILGTYLLGRRPVDAAVALYAAHSAAAGEPADSRDAAIAHFGLSNPWSLAAIDTALSWVEPRALLRRKMLVMVAILETRPEYAGLFLSSERPWWYPLYVAVRLAVAAVQGVAGIALLRLVG